MLCWQGFLIVAALTAAATDTRPPDAAQIFRCDFEEADDADFDHWPDRWTRQRGAGYPRYLPMQIVHEGAAQGTAALKMDLDGGAAALHGPAMDVSPNFSYQLELSVKTSGLQHDRAFASVTFRDTQGKDVEHLNSELVRDAREWTRLRVGPFTPSNPEARSMIIGLHLEPGVKADLHGWAMFDDIWLGQLPRVTLTLNHPYHLYTDPRQVEMSCQVSGVYDKSPRLAWEIVNLQGEIVAKDERLLEAALPTPTSRTRGAERGPQPEVSGFRGSAKWRPDLKNTGFFRGRVRLSGQAGQLLVRELTLAVLDPKPTPSRGEFGWTVAELDSAKPMLQLLPHVGVNWVKFPVWFSEAQMPRLDQVVNVAERLGIQHI